MNMQLCHVNMDISLRDLVTPYKFCLILLLWYISNRTIYIVVVVQFIFKRDMCQPLTSMHGFLKPAVSGKCVYACLCVCLYACVCVCMCACACLCVRTCM